MIFLWTVIRWGLAISAAVTPLTSVYATGGPRTNDLAHDPRVCVIIRTYWKHGLGQVGLLQRLIQSLRRQTHARWEAQILVMDSTPFYNLTDILQLHQDDRLWVYGNLVGDTWRPKTKDGAWEPEYHTLLYQLTDKAARGVILQRYPVRHRGKFFVMQTACSADTEWVLFTNGDNLYHKDAFAEVVAAGQADAIAMDFYSRYSRPTGVPCERFQQENGAPVCKVNRMRWCHTDLGSVAYRWSKLVKEDLRFASMQAQGRFTGQDALMAEAITDAGWNIVHLRGKCLFDQGPNPTMCARMGGIWDDRKSATTADFGGHCNFDTDIDEFRNDSSVEVVNVTLANDGAIEGLALASDETLESNYIFCIRPVKNFRHMLIPAFGEACVEDVDRHLYLEYQGQTTQRHDQHPKARERSIASRSSWKLLKNGRGHDEL